MAVKISIAATSQSCDFFFNITSKSFNSFGFGVCNIGFGLHLYFSASRLIARVHHAMMPMFLQKGVTFPQDQFVSHN